MTDRIKKLCAYLERTESFADVGCDHGYCTRYMLDNGLCDRAVISDISAPCLNKAEKLLSDYISVGKVTAVCCAGLEKVPECSLVLIAGMGGERICEILQNAYIPASFLFQPMKNAEKLRQWLISRGAHITADEPFESGGKFYFVIKGRRGDKGTEYSPAELAFGKNLGGETTRRYIRDEYKKRQLYLEACKSEKDRARIEGELSFMQGVLNGEIK